MVGNNEDSDLFRGKAIRLNLRIGYLVAANQKLSFEPASISQMMLESNEQNDDMMSKMSSMSKLSIFKAKQSSQSVLKDSYFKSKGLQKNSEFSPVSRA